MMDALLSERGAISEIARTLRENLEKWKHIKIEIGITGDSGTGKSRFINEIRGLDVNDPRAAKVGVTEITTVPQSFLHPTNEKIKFWDLPGIGTPNYPDLETYCEKVKLETYDTFLIFTAGRFTDYDLELAKKIKSVGKKFFFIRTKIDYDVQEEREKRSFNEKNMLAQIRSEYFKNLSGLVENEEDIFLISNRCPTKWDFGRLTKAILDALPERKREALTLSLDVLTSMSADILKRKIQALKDRIWMVSAASAAAALVPIPRLSIAVDLTLITNVIKFYKSQLGLPEEAFEVFVDLTPENQQRIRKFDLATAADVERLMETYSIDPVVENWVRYIPLVGQAIASCKSYPKTYNFLDSCLTDMEKTAFSVLEEIKAKIMTSIDFESEDSDFY